MGRRVAVPLVALVAALLALPAVAAAVRPATEQEVAEFTKAAEKFEHMEIACATPDAARATASDESCIPPPRPDYRPVVTEARVSTLDESQALAFVAPVPRTAPESATVIFHRDATGWLVGAHGNDCSLGERVDRYEHGTGSGLVRDLVESMGCTPRIPTKVRCLDNIRTSLLALEEPRQCAVSGPRDSPFPGWMNIREVRWRNWGSPQRAVGKGVIYQLPAGLLNASDTNGAGPGLSRASVAGHPAVRLIATGLVDCGTSYFYSHLRVVSPFTRFSLTLPTCPDVFFGPGP
jgi:hypothetical protein